MDAALQGTVRGCWGHEGRGGGLPHLAGAVAGVANATATAISATCHLAFSPANSHMDIKSHAKIKKHQFYGSNAILKLKEDHINGIKFTKYICY